MRSDHHSHSLFRCRLLFYQRLFNYMATQQLLLHRSKIPNSAVCRHVLTVHWEAVWSHHENSTCWQDGLHYVIPLPVSMEVLLWLWYIVICCMIASVHVWHTLIALNGSCSSSYPTPSPNTIDVYNVSTPNRFLPTNFTCSVPNLGILQTKGLSRPTSQCHAVMSCRAEVGSYTSPTMDIVMPSQCWSLFVWPTFTSSHDGSDLMSCLRSAVVPTHADIRAMKLGVHAAFRCLKGTASLVLYWGSTDRWFDSMSRWLLVPPLLLTLHNRRQQTAVAE